MKERRELRCSFLRVWVLALLPVDSDNTHCAFVPSCLSHYFIPLSHRHSSLVSRFGAGIKLRTVFDAYVAVPPNVSGQDEAGRLWDVVWMLRFAIQRTKSGVERLPFALYVRNDNRAATLIKLIAVAGPRDIDDPAPAITVMMPDED